MRARKLIEVILLSATFTLFYQLLSTESVTATSLSSECSKIEIITARGSGVGEPLDEETRLFTEEIRTRLDVANIKLHSYALGTEEINNSKYPHAEVSGSIKGYANLLEVAGTSGNAGLYGASVRLGVKELRGYLEQRYQTCNKHGSYYMLGGYSQGAHVIGQALEYIDKKIRDRIVFVGLFGDPKLHYPEGKGLLGYAPACRGEERSTWRRGPIHNCNLGSGALGSRKPYLPNDMQLKTGLWCNEGDIVCGDGHSVEAHGTYRNPENAISDAAKEAAIKLQSKIRSDPLSDINADAIDISTPATKIPTLDYVFVVNTSNSMRGYLEEITDYYVEFARSAFTSSNVLDVKIALVAYRDTDSEYPTKVLTDFTNNLEEFKAAARQGFVASSTSSDGPEGAIDALITSMQDLRWRKNSSRTIALHSNATFHNPDRKAGATIGDFLKAYYRAEGPRLLVNVPDDFYPDYFALLRGTTYELSRFTFQDRTTFGATLSFEDIQQLNTKLKSAQAVIGTPVAQIGNTHYKSLPGETIKLDASLSYVDHGTITEYAWDIDADGVDDYVTNQPVTYHSYRDEISTPIRLRVTDSHGQTASGYASVTIAHKVFQPIPSAPVNFSTKVVNTTDNTSAVTFTWDAADTYSERWLLAMDDTALGYMPSDRRSVTITDIDRSEDVTFNLVGQNSDGVRGEFAEVVVPALTTPPGDPETPEPPTPEEPETPTEPGTPPKNPCEKHTNYFIRMACETAERLKAQARAFLGQFYFIIGVR